MGHVIITGGDLIRIPDAAPFAHKISFVPLLSFLLLSLSPHPFFNSFIAFKMAFGKLYGLAVCFIQLPKLSQEQFF